MRATRNPPRASALHGQDLRLMSTNLAHALGVIGDRWTLQIVADLFDGPKRFGELADSLQGIAPNVLTSRLRQLERQGLVVATPYSQRPVRLAYAAQRHGTRVGRSHLAAVSVGRAPNG